MDVNSKFEEGDLIDVGRANWEGMLINFDNRFICDIKADDVPIDLPAELIVEKKFLPVRDFVDLTSLPSFHVNVAGEAGQVREWLAFLNVFYHNRRVAVVTCDQYEMAFHYPRREPTEASLEPITVFYAAKPGGLPRRAVAPPPVVRRPAQPGVHPDYLKSVAHTHASWPFGGIAELVDNARDAKAEKVEISIAEGEVAGASVPMLCVRDNGKGMAHHEMVQMMSLGHKAPDLESQDLIGRFGVGFKTGSLRVGADVAVLTQTEVRPGHISRSIGFLSTAYNVGRLDLEIPIVTFRMKTGGGMDIDETHHTRAEAQERLSAIERFSPFDSFRIGKEFESMSVVEDSSEAGGARPASGTSIFIFHLKQDPEKREYELDWESSPRDIRTRSRRPRTRPGQMAVDVPLDYSLVAYLRLIFIDPRMSIRVQGQRVRCERLTQLIQMPRRKVEGLLKGRKVELKLGFVQEEKERANCGIFIYWHGRLIEAYKRVGRMQHDRDCGFGVIGVIDVSELMRSRDGVMVLNSKQGFEDQEIYADLLGWLGREFDKYWEKYFDKFRHEMDALAAVPADVVLTKDEEWVQCDTCTKWRRLPPGVTPDQLPNTWFCWMPPFQQSCSVPEDIPPEDGTRVTITIGRDLTPAAPARPVLPAATKPEPPNAAARQAAGTTAQVSPPVGGLGGARSGPGVVRGAVRDFPSRGMGAAGKRDPRKRAADGGEGEEKPPGDEKKLKKENP